MEIERQRKNVLRQTKSVCCDVDKKCYAMFHLCQVIMKYKVKLIIVTFKTWLLAVAMLLNWKLFAAKKLFSHRYRHEWLILLANYALIYIECIRYDAIFCRYFWIVLIKAIYCFWKL